MKKSLMSFVFLIAVLTVPKVQAQCDCSPLESLAISLNVGTLGVGLEANSSLTPYLAGRIGVDAFAYTHKYNYEGLDIVKGTSIESAYTVPLKAKAKIFNAHALLDFFPFPNHFPAYLSAGVYVGTPDIIKITGSPEGRAIEIGDIIIDPADAGLVEAAIRTNVFKPYAGLGFGRTVPHSRLGFKCELGAMFHGSPQVKVLTEGASVGQADGELNRFNKFMRDFNVYPVLKLQLIYRFY
ncbi:hypothetical protein EZS27_000268 [termite gut metagenome]|uniref:Outer membrane protein beta-barrel domain-containing protein n=1 Tax=termite gut metagenome TaxID=433724 RepID=A0A5J4T2J1_9ZZZZ